MKLDELLALFVSHAYCHILVELLHQICQVIEWILHVLWATNLHLALIDVLLQINLSCHWLLDWSGSFVRAEHANSDCVDRHETTSTSRLLWCRVPWDDDILVRGLHTDAWVDRVDDRIDMLMSYVAWQIDFIHLSLHLVHELARVLKGLALHHREDSFIPGLWLLHVGWASWDHICWVDNSILDLMRICYVL